MLDSKAEQDVRLQREHFLNELQRQIDNAILHRGIVTFKPTGEGRYTAEEELAESNRWATKIRSGIRDQKEIVLRGTKKENEVRISNSHDFKDLLILSYRKMGFSEEVIPSLVKDDLRHEYAHHVPVLGQPGIKIEYGVSFLYDPKMNARGIHPFVSITGKNVPLDIIRQYFKGPSDPSSVDSVMGTSFELPFHLKVIKAAKERLGIFK